MSRSGQTKLSAVANRRTNSAPHETHKSLTYTSSPSEKKRGHQRGGLESNIQPDLRRSPFRPAVTAPIPATFVLAERDAWARPPVILVNNYSGRRWIVVALMAVPANWAGTYNCRRCGGRGRSENACAHRHSQKCLVEWFHFGTPIMTSRRKNKLQTLRPVPAHGYDSEVLCRCENGYLLRVRPLPVVGAASPLLAD
jgi:hypothetical protein